MGLESLLKPLERAPRELGSLLLADLHNHISKATSRDRLLQIVSYGVLGVTRHMTLRQSYIFDELIEVLLEEAEVNPAVAVTELEPGLARVEHETTEGKRTGYILETSEALVGSSHIVTFGGDTPPVDLTIEELSMLKESGATVILAHPYEIQRSREGFMMCFITERYLRKHPEIGNGILKVAELVDAIEGFNAQFPVPYRHCNEMAASLAQELGLPGILSTDSHPYQIAEFLTGFYIPVPNHELTIRDIAGAIKQGNFIEGPKRYLPMTRFFMSYVPLVAKLIVSRSL